MTYTKIANIPGTALKPVLVVLLAFLLLGSTENLQAQEVPHSVTHLYTDFGGFWSSGDKVQPDNTNNVIGFTYNGATYSTGVDDARLEQEKIDFTPMDFRALPVLNISISHADLRFGVFGERYDGIPDGVPSKDVVAFKDSISLNVLLRDGLNGLDISTGVTNMLGEDENPLEMPFFFQPIENLEEIENDFPDILVSQIAEPGEENPDEIWFADAQDNQVGKKLIIVQTELPELGKTRNDFFYPDGSIKGDRWVNAERAIRISAFKASDFGLDSTNYKRADKLIYKMGGKSDPAFIAYNTNLINVLVANNDKVSIKTNESVTISILDNDRYSETVTASPEVFEQPENGEVQIENNVAIYKPNKNYTGKDTFRYELCNNAQNCAQATVTVSVNSRKIVSNPALISKAKRK